MSNQIFGRNNKNKKRNDELPNEPLMQDPAELNKIFTIRILLLILFICGLLYVLFDDNSSVLFCDMQNDNCELRIKRNNGSKEVKKVINPSKVKDIHISHRCFQKDCHIYLYLVNDEGKDVFLYGKDSSKIFFKSKRKKFNKAAQDIKYLLENNDGCFEYDILNPVKKP